jgi:hypothetical protein
MHSYWSTTGPRLLNKGCISKINVMILPTIHMNGTSRAELVRGHEAVDDALHTLIDALGGVEFNPRDYYPQGPDAWSAARDQHTAVYAKIREIKAYNDAILEHLSA